MLGPFSVNHNYWPHYLTATMLVHTLTHSHVEPRLLKPVSQLRRTLQGLTKLEGLGEPSKTAIWLYKDIGHGRWGGGEIERREREIEKRRREEREGEGGREREREMRWGDLPYKMMKRVSSYTRLFGVPFYRCCNTNGHRYALRRLLRRASSTRTNLST